MFWPLSPKPWSLPENRRTREALASYKAHIQRYSYLLPSNAPMSTEYHRFLSASEMDTFSNLMSRIYPDHEPSSIYSAVVSVLISSGSSLTKENLRSLQSHASVCILMPDMACEVAIHYFFSPKEASKARSILDKLIAGLIEDMVTPQDILDAVTN